MLPRPTRRLYTIRIGPRPHAALLGALVFALSRSLEARFFSAYIAPLKPGERARFNGMHTRFSSSHRLLTGPKDGAVHHGSARGQP
ncbi:hypothetical protein C8Q79DRAFT_228616 [Trametes meyenii]|nr:hypothetical protein C8Q79DRAFT_228616 [Trametes meyenii]